MNANNSQYQVMPPLTAEEFGVLKADIAEHGVLVPIELDEQGNVLDGYHRVRACANGAGKTLSPARAASRALVGLYEENERNERSHRRRTLCSFNAFLSSRNQKKNLGKSFAPERWMV